MSALKTPAPDASAEEWGRLATQIPDWRWPDGMHDAAPGWVANRYGSGSTGDVITYAREGWEVCPDPDHWSWWGWFIELLGPDHWDSVAPGGAHAADGDGWWAWVDGEWSEGMTLGRACIAAAAAIGRWPGGEG